MEIGQKLFVAGFHLMMARARVALSLWLHGSPAVAK